MSAVDLFLLSFIKRKPWNAFEMAKIIKEKGLDELVKVSTPAVYKNLIKLEKDGYLEYQVKKDGDMPEKKIYSLTKKGDEYITLLLKKISENDIKYYLDFSTVFLYLELLDYEDGMKLIENIKNKLLRKREMNKAFLVKNADMPFERLSMAKCYNRVNETIIEWINEFEEEFQKRRNR